MGSRAAWGWVGGRGGRRGRKGRARKDREKPREGEKWGREATKQNLRPQRRAKAALLLLKLFLKMFKLCVCGSLNRNLSSPGVAATGEGGEANRNSTALQAGVSAFLLGLWPQSRPSKAACKARLGRRASRGARAQEEALGCLRSLLAGFLPRLSPDLTSLRRFSAVPPDFWGRG